jgi:hypothetical protein
MKRRIRDDGWCLPDALWAATTMCAGPGGDERYLLCAAHRLSVEYAAGDKAVLVFLGAPALQEGTEGIRGVLAQGIAGL